MLIVTAGMRRSGSTLQYNMARNLIESLELGTAEGFCEEPDSPYWRAAFHRWGKDDACHVVKTHKPPPNAIEMSRAGSMRICYIYRDLRDVAASLKLKQRRPADCFIGDLDHQVDNYRALETVQPILWQRYEDVIHDVPQAIGGLGRFLQVDVSPDLVRRVADLCSVERAKAVVGKPTFTVANELRQQISSTLTRLGVPRSRLGRIRFLQNYDPRTLLNARHISKHGGTPGAWRQELTANELETIETRHREWLVGRGYLAET